MNLKYLVSVLLFGLNCALATAGDFTAYYPFEGENAGNRDISAAANHGYFLHSPKGRYVLDGFSGLALKDDVLVVGSFAPHYKDMPFTLSLWVRVDEIVDGITLISKQNLLSSQGFALQQTSQGLSFQLMDDLGQGLAVSAPGVNLPVGTWSHIAVTYSGSGKAQGVDLYLDGNVLTREVQRDDLSGETNAYGPLVIGASLKQLVEYKGAIDEVLIAPAAYTVGQIGCLAIFGADCATAIGAGPRGPKGEKGEPGPTGAPGPQGVQGLAGTQGPKGSTGPRGSKGLTGPRGLTGPAGDKGPAGANGEAGRDGAPGLAGAKGARGEKGRQGLPGPKGPQGAKGDNGDVGPVGPEGPRGYTGPAGDKGPDGPQGATGPKGPDGPQGYAGDPGPKGIQGVRGDKGPQGPQGPRGPKGNTGPAGDRGSKGPKGDRGPDSNQQGPRGPAGRVVFRSCVIPGTGSIPGIPQCP